MRASRVVGILVALALVASTAWGYSVTKKYRGNHVFDQIRAGHYRVASNATISGTTNYNTTSNELFTNDFFPVSTTAPGGATLDIDIGDDAAIDANEIGSQWTFMILTGSSAMTVTAGASGFTTVTTINASGTTCEDAGDYIRCTARSTTAVTCLTVCAD